MKLRANIALTIAALHTLSACNQDIDDNSFSAIAKVEGEADHAARLCLSDAMHVLPEHSGNCVATTRYLAKMPQFSQCHGDAEKLPKCKSLLDGYHRILDMHWRAVAISLANQHNPAGYNYYLDEPAMFRDFDRCRNANEAKGDYSCVPEGADVWPKLR